MTDAYICDAIRTPIGRYGGALATVRTDDLAAVPLRALVQRNPGVDWAAADDLIFGCATRQARTIAMSRAWRRCSPVCRRRSAALRSIGCVGRASMPWQALRG